VLVQKGNNGGISCKLWLHSVSARTPACGAFCSATKSLFQADRDRSKTASLAREECEIVVLHISRSNVDGRMQKVNMEVPLFYVL
jgi:hypothetical protein